MRAIVISKPGGPEVLQLRDVPEPLPSRGEVRIRIRAAAVNRADLLQRRGKYPPPPGVSPDIPGLECAGEVDRLGDDVTELAVGARVFGIVGGGAYAEYVVAHARTVTTLPRGMAFAEAAAIPEAFITAWDAMVGQAQLMPGETALVSAAGSGVGTAALQIARALGARVIGTARSGAKLERARALGLTDAIAIARSPGPPVYADHVLALTDGRGADVILELVGGAYLTEDLACVAPKGRIVVVGTMAGTTASVDLGALMHKRARIHGTVLRSRPLEEKIGGALALGRYMVPLFSSGALRPVIDRVFPLEAAADAHRLLETNDTFGKIVLEVGPA